MKEIEFSNLTLDLKKQFIYFLAKNNINFHQLRDSKFLTTKIRIVGSNNRPTRIVIKPEDIWHLANKTKKVSKYHINCQEEALKFKTPTKNKKRRKKWKTDKKRGVSRSKSMRRINKLKKNPGRIGSDLIENLDSYLELRDQFRAEPKTKVDKKKFRRMMKEKKNFTPNKEKNFDKEDIYYQDDIENKEWFYRKLGKDFSDRISGRRKFFSN